MKRLKVKTKKQTLFSIMLIHSLNFQESRRKTKKGKILFNEEIDLIQRAVKKHGIKLKKKLPKKMAYK